MPFSLVHRLNTLFSGKKEVAEPPEVDAGPLAYELSNLVSNKLQNSRVGIIGQENSQVRKILGDTMVPRSISSGKSLVIASELMARGLYEDMKAQEDTGGMLNPETADWFFLFNPAEGIPQEVHEVISKDQDMTLPMGHFFLYFPEGFFETPDDKLVQQWLEGLTNFMNPYLQDRHPSESDGPFSAKAENCKPRVPFYLGGLEGFKGPLFSQLAIQAAQAVAFKVEVFLGVGSITKDLVMGKVAPILADMSLLVFPDKDNAARNAEMYTMCDYLNKRTHDTDATPRAPHQDLAVPEMADLSMKLRLPAIIRWPDVSDSDSGAAREVIRVW